MALSENAREKPPRFQKSPSAIPGGGFLYGVGEHAFGLTKSNFCHAVR
jgi:hypothetical protein